MVLTPHGVLNVRMWDGPKHTGEGTPCGEGSFPHFVGGSWPGQLPVHGTTQTQHSRPMTLRHHTPGVPPTEDTSAGAATFKMACAYTCVCEEEPRRSQEEPRSSQEQPRSSQEQPKSSPGEAQRQPSTYFWPEGGAQK